jgi:nicotinamide N-methyltransferase
MLTDRITLSPSAAELEPEDYLSTSLGVIFPDDITNQHGDPSTPVIYTSPRFGKIFLSLADPVGEGSRRLFAQYLWNAGVYVAIGLEDAFVASEDGDDDDDDGVEPGRGMGVESWTAVPPTWGMGSGSGKEKREKSGPEKVAWDVRNETVLELGAGTGIAGIVAMKAGAKEVVITDYPAEEVLLNLRENVKRNLGASERGRCFVRGHEWGMVPKFASSEGLGGSDEVVIGGAEEKPEGVLEGSSSEGQEVAQVMDKDINAEIEIGYNTFPATQAQHFTRILLADCLWMPSQHANLHRSIAHFLAPSGYAIVVAGFHTGRAKMAPFFDAEALSAVGLEVESIAERDAVGKERQWRSKELGDAGEGREDLSERKRWLVVAVLRRIRRENNRDGA